MKQFLLAALTALTMVASASAQSFSFGGRYSNYATEVDANLVTFDTGRSNSVGLIADFRSGRFLLTGRYDHDFENGFSVSDLLPIDVGEFGRDRFEVTVGVGATPYIDLEAGFRSESMTFGGGDFFDDFFDDQDLTHQALVFGAAAHSETIRPVGWYVSARGYVGTAEIDFAGLTFESDTTGAKFEIGVPIPVGLSGWEVIPALEFEHLETDDFGLEGSGLEFDTNRFIINFMYDFGR